MTSAFDQTASKPAAAGQFSDAHGDPARNDVSGVPEGTDGYTPRRIRDAVLELLKYGLLEANRKPNLYRDLLAQRERIGLVLEPLDLALKIDEVRGIAYLLVADQIFDTVDDEWSHPLVRRQRLNLEQSLLIAILRQQFVAHEQQSGVGESDAIVAIEDLLPQLQLYFGNLGSDLQEQKRLRNLLEQLKGHGIVSDIDEHDRIAIRPIIAHLANPENLQSLLHAFRAETRQRESLERLADESER